MKTILITGGAGFIGSAFTHYIFDKYPDYKIIVVDCLTYAGAVENLPVPIWQENDERFNFWYGNVTNGELMDTLVSMSDLVVHFAAESHVTRSIYDNTNFFQTDVLGTQIISNAVCKYIDRVERFIHISSSEVYGTAVTEKMDETHPLNPMSPYAAAKAGADRLVHSYCSTYNIPAVILRPFNNYGPRQHLEKVIPRFITSVMLKKKLRIHGDGMSARDFIFVEDTCRAIDLVLHAKPDIVIGEVFNIGSEKHRSILSISGDIIEIMCQDQMEGFVHIGDRPGQVLRHTSDNTKIKSVLNWHPTTEWKLGLEKTIQWYQDNALWWEKQLWMREIPIISASGNRELH
ncbi:MAG: GDP-mannose 4,6-dehydratase [Desulfobacterales bacterium]|jgi:dTDP-glucose 4,6-dehydratase|nr:GDP-mannose 4,6-dehydratase [Desulfobacterales bacterium]MDP6806696.1 GDP-mannose 4,6-dehydratase [Desulfobacterales bacterium]|tara:strand:+ start:7525 stop:8562 length:1038 start_codon:yes stop_codon:yes gene_type:complete